MTEITKENDPTGRILEVGPGKGVFTEELVKTAKAFKAVELDREMAEYLLDHEILPKDRLIRDDFLRLDLTSVFEGSPFSLVGNFPYNISSQIVLKMVKNHSLIPFSLGMFQLEMAHRITGKVNTKDYGSLAILTQLFYDCQIVYKVKPGDFSPPPKVHSAVVRFIRKKDFPEIDPDRLEVVFRRAFSHRRKKIKNNLNAPEELQVLTEMDLTDLRAEQISIEVMLELAERIYTLL